jgi:hypothetical protein
MSQDKQSVEQKGLHSESGRLLGGAGILMTLVGAFLLAQAALVAGPGGQTGDALAAPGTPVPTGNTDVEGLLFAGNPSNNIDWTDGNVCAGNRPAPGCYGDGQNVPHRFLLKDLTIGASYEVLIEHDFQDEDGVVGYENFNTCVATSGATGLTLTFLGTFDAGGGRTEKRWRLDFTATAVNAEIRCNALLGPFAHMWNGSQLHVRLTEGAESVPIPVNEIVPPSTPTPVPPTSTPVPPTSTPVPPTSTPVPGTSTPVPPTSTPVPGTSTPVPPTSTPVPGTSTPVPPTSTSVPATSTAVPPTSTSVPATSTAVPPTSTSVPAATPVPASTPVPEVVPVFVTATTTSTSTPIAQVQQVVVTPIPTATRVAEVLEVQTLPRAGGGPGERPGTAAWLLGFGLIGAGGGLLLIGRRLGVMRS